MSDISFRPRRTRLCIALAAAMASTTALAQTSPRLATPQPPSIEALALAQSRTDLILSRAGIFDPQWEQLDARSLGMPESAGSRFALLQFQTDAEAPLKWMAERGIEALEYLPHNAWRVRLNGHSLRVLRADSALRFAGPEPSLLRMDPALWPANRANALAVDAVDGRIELRLHRGESADVARAAIAKLAPALKWIETGGSTAEPWLLLDASGAAAVDMDALLSIEGIAWIAPAPRPQLWNQNALGPMQGNNTTAVAGTPIFGRGLSGSGQIVAVADSGMDRNEDWFTDIDFGDGQGPRRFITPADSPLPPALGATHPLAKVFAYWVQPGATAFDNNNRCTPTSAPTSFHGTHVAGTVAGDRGTLATPLPPAGLQTVGDGMAPNAQILFQDIGNDPSGCLSITNLQGTLAQAQAGGAGVHNNSWGSDSAGAYGGSDIDVDAAARRLRELLVVIAAGNSGAGANTVGSPGNNKNGLTVGALGNGNSLGIASFSSRGPTDDNRIKPDIVAPGSATVSAAGDTNNGEAVESGVTSSKSGTSMASPTITGSAALARQYFADGFYPRGARSAEDSLVPSAVVMKALLLNSTRAIESAGTWPNNTFGWGRLWLEHSLFFNSGLAGGPADSRRLRLFERSDDAGLVTGDVHAYTLANVAAGEELRFTLTWFDPAASAGAAITLVNDLDLEVVGPDASLYLGNVFTAGVSTTGGTADRRNTVEQVRFTAPAAGSYTVRVRGFNVPGDVVTGSLRQGYGLAVSGALGLPDAPALPAPAGLSVAANGLTGVDISFNAVAGAQGYQLYRADGSCATADPKRFRMVAHGTSSPLTDTSTVGGYGYAWKLRAIGGDVEGEVSTCVDAVSAAACTLTPEFSMADASANGNRATCGVAVDWTAAQSRCPLATGISYRIERSDRPDFQTSTVLADGHPSSDFLDSAVLPDRAYFYRVSAADANNNRRSDPKVLAATPSPAAGPSASSFLDNVDTRSYARLQAPWQFSTVASDGSFSYHNAPDGQNYASDTCASLTLPPMSLGADATLTYKARYALEQNWDGVVTQISADGGQSWASLPPAGGFPGSFADTGNPPVNACQFPASQGAFSGSSGGQFLSYSSDLSAFEGQTVQIRWVFSSDPASEEPGFYLDEIRLDSAPIALIHRSGFEAGEPPTPIGGGPQQCQLD